MATDPAQDESVPEELAGELKEVLRGDVDRIYELIRVALEPGDDQGELDARFNARQLFRATFAYFEAMVFTMKTRAALHLMAFSMPLSDGERMLAADRSQRVAENGTVKDDSARISLANNLRFAFSLTNRALGTNAEFDNTVWNCLRKSIKVRDRLTHPKKRADVVLEAQELIDLHTAYTGFNAYIDAFPQYPAIPPDKAWLAFDMPLHLAYQLQQEQPATDG